MVPDCQASKFYKHSERRLPRPFFFPQPFWSLRGCTRIRIFQFWSFPIILYSTRMNRCALTTAIDLGQTHQPDSLEQNSGWTEGPTRAHCSMSRPGAARDIRQGLGSGPPARFPFRLEEEGKAGCLTILSVSFSQQSMPYSI